MSMALLCPSQPHSICVPPSHSHLYPGVSGMCVCMDWRSLNARGLLTLSSLLPQEQWLPVLPGTQDGGTRVLPKVPDQIEGFDPSPTICTCCSQTQPPGCTLSPVSHRLAPSC